MSVEELMASAMGFAITHFTQVVTFRGAPISCKCSESRIGATLADAGYFDSNTLQVVMLTSSITSEPLKREIITYNAKEYRIDAVQTPPGNQIYVINCVQVTG